MTNSYVKPTKISDIGAEITSELGSKFREDFISQKTYDEPEYFLLGRKILSELLAQPGCEGLKLCNAINEEGDRTLVYMAIDKTGKELEDYLLLNSEGSLTHKKAIIADRSFIPTIKPSRPGISTPDTWEWTID